MFGYITANMRELKIKEYYRYRSWYCGLCRSLRRQHGLAGQLSLSYDMAFLAMVLSELYEPPTDVGSYHCIPHPLRKHQTRENIFTEYSADMNMLLTYYKCRDDWKDERRLDRFIYSLFLIPAMTKIRKRYPRQTAAVVVNLAAISRCETDDDQDLDKVSGLFGRILGAVFVWRDDEWKDELYRMGFFLGKFIYLLDAYDDMEEDKREGNYNVLLGRAGKPGFEEDFRTILTMTMAECVKSFERLPIIRDAQILRNILYSGVWSCYHPKSSSADNGSQKGTGKRHD